MESLILTYSYWIILPLSIIEGPVVILFASFLASTGLLDISVVYLLGLLGDIIGDELHYLLGRFGGRTLIQKYGRYLGISEIDIFEAQHKYFGNGRSIWRVITLSKVTHAPSSIVMLACVYSR